MLKKLLKLCFYQLPAAYVLMFHHIDDGSIVAKSGCVLKKDEFIKILDSGLQFISMKDCLDGKRGGGCIITFDDGLADLYRVAYPELKRRNIPFTIFIATGLLDHEGYISISELQDLANDPLVTIGSHGITHKVFKGMSIEEQRIELIESKKLLESITGQPIETFAYSHGQYDRHTIKLLKSLNCYKRAFSTKPLPINLYTQVWRYNLPRINVDDTGSRFIPLEKRNKVVLRPNH